MEHEPNCSGSVCDRLPPVSGNYPWFVGYNVEAEEEPDIQFVYTIQDSLFHRFQPPEPLEKHIRGCYFGWVILTDLPHMWDLWNPVTSKIIRLPPLILKDGKTEDIGYACLSAPPDDPTSILLLTTMEQPKFVFCTLHRNRKWTEMSYAKQVMNITGVNDSLCCLTCCNGKVYAVANDEHWLIHIDIVFKGRQVVIRLSPILKLPYPDDVSCSSTITMPIGSCTELFTIVIGLEDDPMTPIGSVHLYKLDTTSITWVEMEDLNNAVFSVDLCSSYPVIYSPAVSSELGGYIHLLCEQGKIIYSYHIKNKTLSLSSLPCLVQTNNVESRLEDYHADSKLKEDKGNEIVVRSIRDQEVEFSNKFDESLLLDLPFDVLRTIMEFCVGIEYLKFRATCNLCRLAAPMIRWRNEISTKRLQTYSLTSPWLMVFDKHQGVMIFTDPVFGDKYFIKTPQELICEFRIHDSRYGWLLILKLSGQLLFFNPFTNEIRELPPVPYLYHFCFSAPPTSTDCMVVGFSEEVHLQVFIHFVAREPSWRRLIFYFGGDPYSFYFPTFYGRDLYLLCTDGYLDVLKEIGREDYSWENVIKEAPTSCCRTVKQYYLVKYDQDHLLVIVGKFGKSVEVFKLNVYEYTWEKIDSLGRHMICICDSGCICIQPKTPKMENAIYFPRLHSNGNSVFYSLETGKYHTFDGENIQETFGDFFGTKHHIAPHAWIEPSWS